MLFRARPGNPWRYVGPFVPSGWSEPDAVSPCGPIWQTAFATYVLVCPD